METQYELAEGTYLHIVLDGSHYQAGRLLAKTLRNTERLGFCFQPFDFDAEKFGYSNLAQMQRVLEQYCPGFNEEIQGFADELALPIDKVFHYSANSQAIRACSHFAVHPSNTKEGKPLLGRSYEMAPNDEDRLLITSRINGRAKSIGFSTIIFGKLDGINEHGLAATMSASIAPPQREKAKGFDFWVFMRAVLDTCHSVAEALDLLREFPLNAYTNFLLLDASGEGALIEVAGSMRAIRQFDGGIPPYLIAVQHYSLPEMATHNLDRDLNFSAPRYSGIKRHLEADVPFVTVDNMKGILSSEAPNGSFCPYYNTYGLGTLWSEVFHPAERTVELTFGSVTHNPWYTFGMMDSMPGAHEYIGIFASKVS
jgi:predicted choloylglycine hydrolase